MADVKPTFDPSQPFDPVQKPAFDASQPFQAGQGLNGGDQHQSEAVRVPLGVAQGVAEAMNPLNIPHGVETLARTPFEPNDPTKGFVSNILNKLSKADQDSKIPTVPVNRIAAGVRTLMDTLDDAPHAPTLDRIKGFYQQELKSQNDYDQNFINPTANQAGQIGAGVISLGSLANDAANAMGAAPKLKALSNESYVASLKPTKGVLQMLQEGNQVQPLGEELGSLKPGMLSWSGMSEKVNQQLNEWGQQIGHFTKTADQAAARDSSIRGVLVDDIQSRVSNQLVPQLIADGKAGVAQDVQKFVDQNILPASGGSGELGFQQTQKIKRTIQQMKAKFGTANDTPTKDAFQDLYGIVNDLHEEGIESALQRGGSEESLAQFQNAKEKYGLYKKASDVLDNTLARQGANRLFSLSDYIMGAHQAAEGAVNMNPEQTLKGLGLAIVNKIARERGNQALGSLFDRLSQTPNALNLTGAAAGSVNSLPQSQEGNP